MTKRFKFNGATNCIEYDDKSILLDSYGEDIEELLNELHEQLETCKDANIRCCNEYSAMRRDVLRYKEEKEQLKSDAGYWAKTAEARLKEIEQLKHRLAISEKANLVTTLEKENEQLKLELGTYKEANTLLKKTIDKQLTDNLKLKTNLNKSKKENKQLKNELFETRKDYILETYADNPIRRDEKLKALEKEYKKNE